MGIEADLHMYTQAMLRIHATHKLKAKSLGTPWSGRAFCFYALLALVFGMIMLQHNIIQTHSSVPWEWKCSEEYSLEHR